MKSIGDVHKLSPILEEEVLRPYSEILSDFDKSQKLKWIHWKDQLPKKVAAVEKKHLQARDKADFWQNLTYAFVVLSATIPIIVAILVSIETLTTLASLIDAAFPAMVGIVQTKLSASSKRRHALAQVVSPFRTLLSSIIVDIYEKKFR